MFANSNPLNAAVFSNLKNDSEVRNKNYHHHPPRLENSVYGNCRKGKVSLFILCSRTVVKFLPEDPSCIVALVQE